MSNNKQSMKLYTEEQVKQMFEQFQTHLPFHYEILLKEHMNQLTPIELPSDEEIEQLANDYRSISEFCDIEYFADGAVFAIKWMRDKIQGGNK